MSRFWFSFRTVRQANCTRLDIERHRLYAGSTGSFDDCEEYAHLTSLRHDLTGCGVTGGISDCDTIMRAITTTGGTGPHIVPKRSNPPRGGALIKTYIQPTLGIASNHNTAC
ncbi:hypothetical protein J6590_087979 [Homalodisca vitripennis]|nr:hypothetical protein J6590_087979 [Homalodisca vitripennis]